MKFYKQSAVSKKTLRDILSRNNGYLEQSARLLSAHASGSSSHMNNRRFFHYFSSRSTEKITYEVLPAKNSGLTRKQFKILDKLEKQSRDLHAKWDQSFGLQMKPAKKKDSVSAWLKDYSGFIVVAFDGDRPVGFCVAGLKCPFYKGVVWLNDLVVDESLRGHGIGKGLTREAIAECRRRKFKAVILNVTIRNIVAQDLYDQLGFQDWERNMVLKL